MPAYVQKVRIPIRLAQPSLAPRDGWVLLVPELEETGRPETVLELLNSSRAVIPFIHAEDDAVLLLNRVNIDWVAVSETVPPQWVLPFRPAPDARQRIELRFVDETRVDGVIEWYSGPDAIRLSDHLGSSEAFIAVKTGFGVLVVNKARLRETRIVSSAAQAPKPNDVAEWRARRKAA